MSRLGVFFSGSGWRLAIATAYVALAGGFVYAVADSYVPGKGFTALITFGSKTATSRLPALNELDYYQVPNAEGYDGQYYAQIALAPSLRDPGLRGAVDSLPYRARRILLSWTAYVAGLGRPAWILQVYALQNAVCWLVLAVVLLRWFPPDGAGNLFRWAGVLFSVGLCVSVRNSLTDGPSLLLMALGVWAVEKNREGWAIAIFALGGLAKETNLLGAVALDRSVNRPRPALLAMAWRGLLVVAPLAFWLLYIQWNVGPAGDVGARNFDWPFVGYVQKCGAAIRDFRRPDGEGLQSGLLVIVALTTQFLFFVLRPQVRAPWWRVGAAFAALMVVLGSAVWEGYPGAAARVLVAMQLAFNVLVPRGRAWVAVLVLGNLTLLNAPDALLPPTGDGYRINGAATLLVAPDGSEARVEFDAAWFAVEGRHKNTWQWSRGDGTMVVVNPQRFPVVADVRFGVRAITPRTVQIRRLGGDELWRGVVGETVLPVAFEKLILAPGRNAFAFTTDQPAAKPERGDPRALALCVRNLVIGILRPTEEKPAPR